MYLGTLAMEQLQELQGCPWIPSSETLAWSCTYRLTDGQGL